MILEVLKLVRLVERGCVLRSPQALVLLLSLSPLMLLSPPLLLQL